MEVIFGTLSGLLIVIFGVWIKSIQNNVKETECEIKNVKQNYTDKFNSLDNKLDKFQNDVIDRLARIETKIEGIK